MKLRQIAMVFCAVTAAATPLATPAKAAAAIDGRPNIIFIMADDHAAHAASCYGSEISRTPNIDRLAEEGIRFTHALGVNSLCAPARANLLTGKHTQANGVRNNFTRFDSSQQTFPKLLQGAGYETAVIGKWHLKSEPTGFDHYSIMSGHGRYFDCPLRQKGQGKFIVHKTKLINCSWGQYRQLLSIVREISVAFRSAKVAFFRSFAERKTTINDRTMLSKLPKEKEERTRQFYQVFIKGYLRLIASLDENVGRLLDYVDASGLREDTVVVCTSDNGFFMGDHGLFNKMWMYEVPPHVGVRTKTHKLIHFPTFKHGAGPYWELFDLRKDLGELRNVHGDPKYSPTAEEMKRRLQALIERYGENTPLENK